MHIKTKPATISRRCFYVSLAVFLLSLFIVYTSSNEGSEFFPSLREIARFFFIWVILPFCIILSISGGVLAVIAIQKSRIHQGLAGLLLNLGVIAACCGYLLAFHSGIIDILEMSPYQRIQYALQRDYLWMIRWDLTTGADVNFKYIDGQTLLMHSIETHNKKLFKLVLDYNPDVNLYCDIRGKVQTPLHCIAGSNEKPAPVIHYKRIILRQLMESAALTERNSHGSTGAGVMALSAKERVPSSDNKDWDSLEAARLLLEQGADPELKLASSDQKHFYRDITALSLAYDNAKAGLVDLLLSRGADVNVRVHYHQQTLLHAAVERGDIVMIKRLVERGAELDVKYNDPLVGSISPLQMAAAFGDLESAKVLIENGANINITFSDGIGGNTPLHLAVMAGHIDMVQLLLNYHADVNARAIDGRSPLHAAVDFSKGKTESVQRLLEYGADPHASAAYYNATGEKENHTPLTLARERKYSAVVDLISKHDKTE